MPASRNARLDLAFGAVIALATVGSTASAAPRKPAPHHPAAAHASKPGKPNKPSRPSAGHVARATPRPAPAPPPPPVPMVAEPLLKPAATSSDPPARAEPAVPPAPAPPPPPDAVNKPFAIPSAPADVNQTPAVRYAALDRGSCEAELTRRGIAFAHVDSARGVLAPVRLRGALRGVTYRTELPASQRPTSPYEIYDCRLLLALDDFSDLLAAAGVVEVLHFSAYRPPSAKWPSDKLASRHPGGLALDAGKLVLKNGTVLDIEKDFHGSIGATTCAASAGPSPATPGAITLRHLICDAAAAHLFHVMLTPNNDWAHRNHFHLEVTVGAKWFILH